MKSAKYYAIPALVLSAFTVTAWAQKEVTIRRLDTDGSQPAEMTWSDAGSPGEMEKTTFLGVETAPVGRTLATQLGLARDTGLVVTKVAAKSPAADILKEDDILLRLDDQILVNQSQLGVLVRARKEGDEVKLTVVRGGKETAVKAKLGTHEVPRMAGNFYFQNGPGELNFRLRSRGEDGAEGMEHLPELPGTGPEHSREVLRMIARERENNLTGRQVRIITRHGEGSTVLDLPNSNIAYSDDEGAIEIKSEKDQRNLTLKDAKGVVTFQGPINTEEERQKLPPEVKQRIKKIDEGTMNFETDGNFKTEVVPLPPEPTKTKITHELGQATDQVPGRPF